MAKLFNQSFSFTYGSFYRRLFVVPRNGFTSR